MSDNEKRQTRTKKTKYKIHWFRIIFTFILLAGLIGGGVVAGAVLNIIKDVPPLEDTDFDSYAVTTQILDMNGDYVDKLHAEENRVPVSHDEISPYAIQALIAIEDQRFEKHNGIDPIRITGAMVANLKAGRVVQGGSTITQQLVGLVLLDRTEKSYTRKIKEAFLAMEMEKKYSKDEIITHYLNRAYFGGGAYGIEAAAQYFFAKSASELNVPEAALLAGIIQNPSKWSPISYPNNALSRRNLVLGQMEEMGYITASEAAEYKASEILLSEKRVTANKTTNVAYANQSFIDHVIEEALDILDLEENEKLLYTGGYKIYTTLDTKVQKTMEDVYADDANFPNQSIQSAMVVTDPKTGAVRGIVGGRHQTGSRQLNRATQSFRQPGSSFKPVAVYAPAFEAGYGPGTVVDDYPKMYGEHMFRNYDDTFRGLITMREAIRRSTNVVAVKAMEMVGMQTCYQFVQNFNFSTLCADDMNLSMALGGLTIGVSPLELSGAYAAFANEGVFIEPYVINKITDKNGRVLWEHKTEKKVVMSEETAYMITSCLLDVVTSGTAPQANLGDRPTAGKTGTTSDAKDVWFAGYTKDYVGIVWMGYDQPKRISSGGGGSLCGPIFKKVLAPIHEGLPAGQFVQPEGVTTVNIDLKSGLLPSTLTPAEYIGSGMFNSKSVPQEISNVWEEVLVDPASGEAYTPNCPGLPEVRVALRRAVPWQNEAIEGIVPTDANLEYNVPCTLHNQPGTGSAVIIGSASLQLTGRGQYYNGELKAVQLNWNLIGDEDTVYMVHRSSVANFTPDDSTLIGNTTYAAYSDYDVSREQNNYYRIIAADTFTLEQMGMSNVVSIAGREYTSEPVAPPPAVQEPAVQEPAVQPPADSQPTVEQQPSNVHTGVQITDNTTSGISLTATSQYGVVNLFWNPPGNGNYQYYLFRSTESDFTPNSSTQIGKNSILTDTTFTDNDTTSGKVYYYKVLAYNRTTNEKSGESNLLQIET